MGVKIEKVQPMGSVEVQTVKNKVEGPVEEVKYPMPAVESAVPMANVGLKMGYTKNLGNYESVRMDVSLFMPCLPETALIEATFKEVEAWVEGKMSQILAELENSGK